MKQYPDEFKASIITKLLAPNNADKPALAKDIKMNKSIDRGSFLVAAITLALFIAALFTKGLSHDLFLEAGVFLVSAKLIIMAYRNSVSVGHLDRKLDTILAKLSKPGDKDRNTEGKAQDHSDQG
jgi:hypothetical protein